MDMSIEIRNLTKNYGRKQALWDVNLSIPQGMFGLLGPNGAGKTTLMKILTTLVKKTKGEVRICGEPLENSRKIRNMTGYLPQDFSMYGNMNAYEALDYLAVLSGMNKAERKVKVPQMLEKVNLLEKRKVKVRAMSGGMKRRLGIAQAIIHDPKVIVVDEPTAGLDPEERVRFRNLLCEIAKDRIVLLSTHIVGDIEATCENIAILNQGEICFQGKVTELLSLVEGKVYRTEIAAADLEKTKERYLVTGILTTGSTANIKIISDQNPFLQEKISEEKLPEVKFSAAKQVKPDVEDAYMYLMHKK
ncbi:ABC transporter ATP-binding protein [Parablautia muri]|uniref:ABC transporter ATP-binding protein n=1 Tax=Parablautia muri TaxID=2320879 RepID=A0A9X5BG32_9FIRM|nr:ABC transporter ATP-binding protein [Parablautia muri]NBJ93059.1 ABC transporter ATP-binding protein [Parablautia muri]